MTKDQQEQKEQFIRVGTTLYKIVNQPSLSGGYIKKRIPWNIETLRQDYGKDYMACVPKYDGFCTVPQHLDYQPVIGKFLNLYEPISHKPMQGSFPCIESLVHHIFGEQYELGMDYLQLLYLQPVQKLPILLLVSEERNTGKSTFLNFLKAVFQTNVTFNTNEDFRSQFNSEWAGKLLIMVDEVLLNRREDSERLKNLSTTFNYKVEAKGKDRRYLSSQSSCYVPTTSICPSSLMQGRHATGYGRFHIWKATILTSCGNSRQRYPHSSII